MTTATAELAPHPLTPEDLDLQSRIREGLKTLHLAQRALYDTLKECQPHSYAQEGRLETAVCRICGHQGGWWCLASPTGCCRADGTGEICRHCKAPLRRHGSTYKMDSPEEVETAMIPRPTDQIDIFSAQKSEAAMNQAVENARIGAYEWLGFAAVAIAEVARRGKPFTTDDVWELLAEHPAESRAMGAAMSKARKEGLCRATADYRNSTRVACHRRPLRIWIPRDY